MLDSDLIDGLYEAALVPELWVPWLDRLNGHAGATAALCARLTGERLHVISTDDEFKDAWDVIMRDHGGASNARSSRLTRVTHAGFITDADVFAPGEVESLPMYRDVLLPRGFGSGLATAIAVPGGDHIILNLEKSRAAGAFPRPVIDALDRIRPHFARAAFLSNRLDVERARSLVQALDHIGLPAAVLDRKGRALAANARLVELMPRAVRDLPSRLRIVDAGADALLATALAALEASRHDAAVRSIPVAAGEDAPPIIFHLTPIKGAAHDAVARARSILVATPVEPRPALGADLVQGLFDLTPAEAKLASLVAGGHPPREAAAALGWTEATARTTLKQVFAKTGVSCQAELVALLGGRVAR